MPVYNIAPYLDRCAASLTGQTYTALEILLVDDGSTDGSAALCAAWAARDARVRCIRQANAGLSAARNAGLAAATGDYIAFTDGDDWLEPDAVRRLVSLLEAHRLDAAGCAFRRVADETPSDRPPDGGPVFYTRESAMAALISERVHQVVWNKLYRRGLIRDIPFEPGRCHEDEFWTWRVFVRLGRYAETGYIGYNYRQRPGSIMNAAWSPRRLDAVEGRVQRQRYLEAAMPSLAGQGRENLLLCCLYNGRLALETPPSAERREAMERLGRIFRDNRSFRPGETVPGRTRRLCFAAASVSFPAVCRLQSLLRVGR